MIIYIMPTIKGLPPRAKLIEASEEQVEAMQRGEAVETDSVEVLFSQDLGLWINEQGQPLPMGVGAMITARAKELGVPWQ